MSNKSHIDLANSAYQAGVEREATGDQDGAMEQYGLSIYYDPRGSEGYLGRGRLFWRLGRIEEAIKDLTNAIRAKPDSSQAFAIRGTCHTQREDWQAAENDFTQAIKLEPGTAALHNKRAQARLRLYNGWGALDDTTRALDLRPDHPPYLFTKGLALELLKDEAGAIEALKLASELGHHEANRVLSSRFGHW